MIKYFYKTEQGQNSKLVALRVIRKPYFEKLFESSKPAEINKSFNVML